jgi:SAM-dependent methyltransferase
MSHTHFGELLDLDAQVLREHHDEVISWVTALLPQRARIVDLGAGTGTGALALARQLPDAEVLAVDLDADILDHLRRSAEQAGLAGRIRTIRADLDQPWPELGPVDLVWASASMHHLADPDHGPTQALALLGPGGRMVVAEHDAFPRFLPPDGGAALEERCHAELARMRTEHGMHMGEDWGARLAAAGFRVEECRQFDIALRPPLPPATGRYAQLSLERMRDRLADRLSPQELAELDAALAGVAHRDDLTVRAARRVWLARRP